MYLLMSLYIAALFAALTPGVLLRIPKGGSKLTVAVVHGLVFAVLYCLTYGFVSRTVYADGFQSSGGGVSEKVMNGRARVEELEKTALQAKEDLRAALAAHAAATAARAAATAAMTRANNAVQTAQMEVANLEAAEAAKAASARAARATTVIGGGRQAGPGMVSEPKLGGGIKKGDRVSCNNEPPFTVHRAVGNKVYRGLTDLLGKMASTCKVVQPAP